MTPVKIWCRAVCCLLLLIAILGAVRITSGAGAKVVVVASTSWTGAIAEAAGADEVRVLAPLELRHPPEYDYRPADIAKLDEAAFLVHAGYEPFVKRLIEAAGLPAEKVAVVKTENEPANLKQQARVLAERLGTVAREREWESRFDAVVDEIRLRARQRGVERTRILVQQHQVPFVKWLGYEIIGVFSADELSPAKVMELARLQPDLVIDNYHNPQGRPIAEVAGCRRAELINFPSAKAPGLIELFRENAGRLGL